MVYAKRPFGGPKQVIEYLGRYTHKVAISNHRIMQVDDATVTFSYKDYRNGSDSKANDTDQRGVCPKVCTAHTALALCAHQALRHTQQHLETWQTAGFTGITARNKKRAACKHIAAQMPVLQNRNTHNHRSVWATRPATTLFIGKPNCTCCITHMGKGTYAPKPTQTGSLSPTPC